MLRKPVRHVTFGTLGHTALAPTVFSSSLPLPMPSSGPNACWHWHEPPSQVTTKFVVLLDRLSCSIVYLVSPVQLGVAHQCVPWIEPWRLLALYTAAALPLS